jgi:hypothetical protein
MTEHLPGPVPDLHIDVAHPARIWNLWLGGKDNFAADRDVARSVAKAMPSVPAIARLARRFQADAVRQLLARGVRQFLDIGTGLPVAKSVHEIAQREAPESRVVYAELASRPGALLEQVKAGLGKTRAELCLTARGGDRGRAVLVAVRVIRLRWVLPAGWFRGSRAVKPGRAPATARGG